MNENVCIYVTLDLATFNGFNIVYAMFTSGFVYVIFINGRHCFSFDKNKVIAFLLTYNH